MTVKPPPPLRHLPLLCRLRGHGWKRDPRYGGWVRHICHRCVDCDPLHWETP